MGTIKENKILLALQIWPVDKKKIQNYGKTNSAVKHIVKPVSTEPLTGNVLQCLQKPKKKSVATKYKKGFTIWHEL